MQDIYNKIGYLTYEGCLIRKYVLYDCFTPFLRGGKIKKKKKYICFFTCDSNTEWKRKLLIVETEIEQYWSVIRFLFLKRKTCDEIKKKIENLVLADRWIKLKEIFDAVKVLMERLKNIGRKFGYEKSIGEMGTAITQGESKTELTISPKCLSCSNVTRRSFWVVS